MATTHSEHNDILELLPWYANGTLSDDEAQRVRDYLQQHPELAAEAKQTNALMDTLSDDVPVPMLTHDRLRNVMEQLDGPGQAVSPVRNIWQRVQAWWLAAPTFALPVATAAALALVAFIVMQQPVSNEGEYRTVTTNERPSVSIQVELEQRVDAKAAEDLFEMLALDAQHESGSVYIVTLPEDVPVTKLYETLQMLRSEDRVVDAKALTDED